MRRLGLALVFGALSVTTVAGCGKSQPTKADYTARANALCAAEVKSLTRLAETRHPPDELIRESFRIHERANAELRAIPIPRGETVPAEWIHLRETAIAAARKTLTSKSHSRENDAANRAYARAEAAALKIALSYGLRGCSGFASA
jgi:hypothetical protein